jgi:glycosyltransferase involved in cell wall biosynthesis
MACGLPIVAPDSARLRWIVGDDEHLIDAENPADIARQIEIADGAAPAGARKSPDKATKFAWPRIGSLYRDFLRKIVEAPPLARP